MISVKSLIMVFLGTGTALILYSLFSVKPNYKTATTGQRAIVSLGVLLIILSCGMGIGAVLG